MRSVAANGNRGRAPNANLRARVPAKVSRAFLRKSAVHSYEVQPCIPTKFSRANDFELKRSSATRPILRLAPATYLARRHTKFDGAKTGEPGVRVAVGSSAGPARAALPPSSRASAARARDPSATAAARDPTAAGSQASLTWAKTRSPSCAPRPPIAMRAGPATSTTTRAGVRSPGHPTRVDGRKVELRASLFRFALRTDGAKAVRAKPHASAIRRCGGDIRRPRAPTLPGETTSTFEKAMDRQL